MPGKEELECLFNAIDGLMQQNDHEKAKEYIQSLDRHALLALTESIGDRVSGIKMDTERFLRAAITKVPVAISIYVQMCITIQSYFDPSIIDVAEPDDQGGSWVQQQHLCWVFFKTRSFYERVHIAIQAYPNTAPFISLGLLPAHDSFIEHMSMLYPSMRLDVLKLILDDLPEALAFDESHLLTESSFTRLLGLLKPHEGLALVLQLAEEMPENQFERYFGLIGDVLKQFNDALKQSVIENKIRFSVDNTLRVMCYQNPDDFLASSVKLKAYLNQFQITSSEQDGFKVAQFFLRVLSGNHMGPLTRDNLEQYKQDVAEMPLLKAILDKSSILTQLIHHLEASLDEAEKIKLRDAAVSVKKGSSCVFFQKNQQERSFEPLFPAIEGLMYVHVPRDHNSFFAAFNASNSQFRPMIQLSIFRHMIARHMEVYARCYKQFFYHDMDALKRHVRQLQSVMDPRSRNSEPKIASIDIDILADLLRKPIVLITTHEGESIPFIEKTFHEEYLTSCEPIFIYRNGDGDGDGKYYSGMHLKPGYLSAAVLDALSCSPPTLKRDWSL